ncbi:hypothetical protein [Mammaliicoccus lentus]|uniref:hypothetical protein n=1 Tax=Mammaliicoccus lentus TaxID=42858 RepID=UPI00107231C7|nr:hypothetical protein [Mammaliicoccus lentus]MBF0793311.1 hypothetical protein [Mammaliicoccus lentus]TFV17817.1 hypothetical protein E4T78_01530 [Mammaliicoccus lentus]
MKNNKYQVELNIHSRLSTEIYAETPEEAFNKAKTMFEECGMEEDLFKINYSHIDSHQEIKY